MTENRYESTQRHIYDGNFCRLNYNYLDIKDLCEKYFNCQYRNVGICLNCLKSCSIIHLERHYCRPTISPSRLKRFVNRGLFNLRKSVIYTILSLKPILGKDMAVFIAKMVFEFRRDILLYNPWNYDLTNYKDKRKRNKTRRYQEEIKDILDCGKFLEKFDE